jgi:hypothetical protein
MTVVHFGWFSVVKVSVGPQADVCKVSLRLKAENERDIIKRVLVPGTRYSGVPGIVPGTSSECKMQEHTYCTKYCMVLTMVQAMRRVGVENVL